MCTRTLITVLYTRALGEEKVSQISLKQRSTWPELPPLCFFCTMPLSFARCCKRPSDRVNDYYLTSPGIRKRMYIRLLLLGACARGCRKYFSSAAAAAAARGKAAHRRCRRLESRGEKEGASN